MRSYEQILDERLHGAPAEETAFVTSAPVHSESQPLDIVSVLRKPKIVLLGGFAAALGVGAAFLSPSEQNNAPTAHQDIPVVTTSQNPLNGPSAAAPSNGNIFKPEPKHIDVTFSGINTADGCVTNVVAFAEQRLVTKPLSAYQREIEIVKLEATVKTCIDENARLFKTEGTLDGSANIMPLTVGLDATSLRTSAEITQAQFGVRTILPGESLSKAACAQIPVAGCPQNPNAPAGIDLDPTTKKAIVATVEAVALQELQKTCAAPIYKAAAQVPAQIMFDQLPGQQIPDSFLTFQIVDQNNKPFGLVPNYPARTLVNLKKSGATLKAPQQEVILGNAKPAITDCGVK